MTPSSHLAFALRRVTDEAVLAVPGGHEVSATISVARTDGVRLLRWVEVAHDAEFYAGWQPEDHQRALLRLHRRLRTRLADLALQHTRERDW